MTKIFQTHFYNNTQIIKSDEKRVLSVSNGPTTCLNIVLACFSVFRYFVLPNTSKRDPSVLKTSPGILLMLLMPYQRQKKMPWFQTLVPLFPYTITDIIKIMYRRELDNVLEKIKLFFTKAASERTQLSGVQLKRFFVSYWRLKTHKHSVSIISLCCSGFSFYEDAVFFLFKTIRCVWVKRFFTNFLLLLWKHFICHCIALRTWKYKPILAL